ncbi:MAG: arginase family protein [Snodgrassella sp.]|nr:arginase family protein [Snodgrassella sp.]
MNKPVILDFDHSTGIITDAFRIELGQWQEAIRFGCSQAKFKQLETELARQLPKYYGTVLMGSGDYHHISLLLIKRLQQYFNATNPIQVVIFDNHPDNMRYLFGIHCGSWVSYVAQLPFVSHVHVLGITSNDIGLAHCWENRLAPLFQGKLTYWCMDVQVSWAKKIGLQQAFRAFASPEELVSAFIRVQQQTSGSVYVSIDKDVLGKDVVQTNWDQGRMQLEHLLTVIAALDQRIIGSDITGEVSQWQYTSLLKRLLSAMDKQEPIPAATLAAWQQQHHAVNQQLLNALAQHQQTTF